MPYRTDRDALVARRETLQRELDAIAEVRAEEQALCDELRSVEKALRVGPLLGLGVPTVAMPCDVPWSGMQGDDRARRCTQCDKNVFNLAAMSDDEVRGILGAGDACVRFYERPDGTVLTADCRPQRRRRKLRMAAAAVTTGAFAASIVAALASGQISPTYAVHSVDQLAINPTLVGQQLRAEGTLVSGSLDGPTGGEFRFALTSPSGAVVRVRYVGGVLPDTFRDLPGKPLPVMVQGALEPTGVFRADQVMARVSQGYIMKDRPAVSPSTP